MQKPLSLHKTTRFRKLKFAIMDICNHENINLSEYNLDNIRCYNCKGIDLNGNDVKFNGELNSKSCFVSNNNYEMYEIPTKTNKKCLPYGKFLFLARNKETDEYVFGLLNINKKDVKIKEGSYDIINNININLYGTYSITFLINVRSNNYLDYQTIVKFRNKYDTVCWNKNSKNKFDFKNIRLKEGYNKNHSETEVIIKKNEQKIINNTNMFGNKIAIYKKRNNKRK